MMFGLPAAALARWRAATPRRRAAVGGIMIPAALTSLVTGVTEPIEFSFIFVAPPLFAVHIVLTGVSMSGHGRVGGKARLRLLCALDRLPDQLPDRHRTGAHHRVRVLYFFVYYLLFYFLITKLNILTPGREPEGDAAADPAQVCEEPAPAASATTSAASGSRSSPA